MLSIKGALQQLLNDVRSQKLRTFLTVCGLVWGTVAVTLLLAFGTGLKRKIVVASAGLGDRIAIAWPGLTSIPFEGLGRGRPIRLTEADMEAVRQQVPGLRGISAEFMTSFKAQHDSSTLNVSTSGISPVFGTMRNLIPQPGGRFINARDMAERRRVIFLGDRLAQNLLGRSDVVGETIPFGGSPFLVVGVLRPKEQDSNYGGPDQDKALIPATTFRALTGRKYLDNFVFQAVTPADTARLTEAIRTVLASRLRFDPTDEEALSCWDTTEAFRFLDVFFLSFNVFLGIMGALTLVVGGIGVSNIMSVVVEERTREIGIKMALGAKQTTILRSFLLETLILTAIGGAAGLAISLGVCELVSESATVIGYVGTPQVSLAVAALTTVTLGIVGLTAGWFPARAASRLDPVVAMKL